MSTEYLKNHGFARYAAAHCRVVSCLRIALALPLAVCAAVEQPAIIVHHDLPYRSAPSDDYARTRCMLDLYLPAAGALPAAAQNLPVLLWFHGGGLEGGDKASGPTSAAAKRFAAAGVVVASVEYRLSPTVSAPAYIEDAAAATAWVATHIADYGGDRHALFIAGHSAGGYLAALLGADARWLTAAGVAAADIAGIIPVSGQTFTHFTISKERHVADPEHTPVIDDYAPCHHVARAKTMPPFLVLCGDHDWPGRADENRCFVTLLKANGATDATCIEVPDRTHGSILGQLPNSTDPTSTAILAFIAAHHQRAAVAH